ncbi:PfkB family carbohydrate kinase [Pseudothermotoga sp.]|uniref:PfkB family carbohydrate kinase n=1 Tax=Pseudothermotoga sp. TaxID=2033661 RepID=UPI0031F65226
MERRKIAVVGGIFIDVYIYGDEPHKCEIFEDCGGSGLNVAVALQRLGFDVFFFSNVGEDYKKNFVLNKLRELNFNETFIKARGGETGLHISMNERTIAVRRGVNDMEIDIDQEILSECECAFLNTEVPKSTIEKFLNIFRGKIFLDVGPRKILNEDVKSLSKDLILIGNESQCKRLNCDVVKMGPRGGRWGEIYVSGDGIDHPYTTGCGDVFDAVLIFSLLHGDSRNSALEKAVKTSQEASKTIKGAFRKAIMIKDLLAKVCDLHF